MEDNVTSSLNLFDIIVRLVPGTLLIMWILVEIPDPAKNLTSVMASDSGNLLALFVIAYVMGALLRAPATLMRRRINRSAYGGSPRDMYLETKAPVGSYDCPDAVVLHDADTLALGWKCRETVARMCGIGEVSARFAFSYMVNFLEAKGCSAKGDRMCCLADMCTSLAFVFAATGLASLFMLNVALGLALLFFAYINIKLFLRYEQMRFSTVIRTFYIEAEYKTRETCVEAEASTMTHDD